ncbi:E3 ubiquitin-protein ligase RNF133 isoform X1 [Acinonyx jubatus]|uniref:E3 ubiquitin-protein ligase RNF133 isoform X1 n=1 Tax=Acinonyx jubatus TaxID=32536 RepID=A0A6I9ZLA3_ACIJB|nr:E3 ubiquitin-protein ligase RNF133 isoform X1 [Acinonyx jubatus]
MTPLKISTYRNKTASSWLMKFSFLWLLSHNCCRASAVWTAYLNISFHVGNRMLSELGEMGVFGRSSTLKRVAGVIVPPDGRTQNACNPSTSFSRLKNSETWLALVERGGCTFTQKIKVAVEKGAGGVIIYNFPGTGNQVFPMSHQAFEDIVVVMIGNLKGVEILHLIQKGVHVTVIVEVGRKHIIWVNHYFVSFVIVTTATLAYFIFYRIRRLWIARIQNRRWQRLTTDLKKAFGQLQLRVLKEGDEEISPNGDSCVVCFELYKPNDTVRILTCKHFFHKSCIDPWILAHGTCPMCKRDILKALGIQVDVEDGTESLQVLMSNELSDALSPDEEETDSELPPVRGSDEVTPLEAGAVPLPPQNDSQPTSVVEDVHPLP